jgi:hypothetical protein
MSTPKGFKGLSIDASSPPAGSDFGAMSQPALSLPPAHHTGGVRGVSDTGTMDKVSFVIVRADQEGLCGVMVNAGMERRLCIREGWAVHKAEDGRAERELSFDHMYLLASVSNNKLVVIPYPRLDLEDLDEVTK